jgi:hypothetical protein
MARAKYPTTRVMEKILKGCRYDLLYSNRPIFTLAPGMSCTSGGLKKLRQLTIYTVTVGHTSHTGS